SQEVSQNAGGQDDIQALVKEEEQADAHDDPPDECLYPGSLKQAADKGDHEGGGGYESTPVEQEGVTCQIGCHGGNTGVRAFRVRLHFTAALDDQPYAAKGDDQGKQKREGFGADRFIGKGWFKVVTEGSDQRCEDQRCNAQYAVIERQHGGWFSVNSP